MKPDWDKLLTKDDVWQMAAFIIFLASCVGSIVMIISGI